MASEWFTPDPMDDHPFWDWTERGPDPSMDTARGTDPTGAYPQIVVDSSTVDAAGYARMFASNLARTGYVYTAHDDVSGEAAAAHGQRAEYRMAEVHVYPYPGGYPDITPPEGQVVEWETGGEWVGPATLTVAWSVRAGYSGGVGSAQATLCRVPLPLSSSTRTDPSSWTPAASLTDEAPFDVTSLPSPVRRLLNDGAPTAGTYELTTYDDTVCLGIHTPEILTPPDPSGYPLTAPAGVPFVASSAWDLYGVGAQVTGITVTRLWQPPRYRFVTPTRGMWRLRQRQSLAGSDGWALRQRQAGGHPGSWPLRQRQPGV